ncbi:ribonuclease HII [Nanoarchaeota archaeon NZ13-N]|uniref:Ribonuclease HII n=1 Tax=Candidatus Nanoclepta minutus TaxID=1940235 RepID=A0A397WMZ9_9ARCH|nr:MAG: ribonuclease HII [Nanoarchaeota archaeon NZ13-N]RIB35445.1 MAG: ribonuclease HII [Candidatus Nanoclepta minutus]
MRILGIDEAGRGPVIGPLVIAGAMIEEGEMDILRELGVRDSKELSRERREEIFEELMKMEVRTTYHIIPPAIIDYYVEKGKLNYLEIKYSCKIIEELRPDRAVIDSFIRNSEKLKKMIYDRLSYKPELIVEIKADKKYPIVSAASIVAKVIRDREIEKIKEEVGVDFGSGYPSDERTIESLKDHYDILKDYVRKTWFTVRKIRDKRQKNIKDFFK